MKLKLNKLLFTAVASLLAFLLADLYVTCLVSLDGPPIGNLTEALVALPDYLIKHGPQPSGNAAALATGIVAVCGIWIVWARSLMRDGEYRDGEEHGSARWGTRKEGRAFMDKKDPDNNLIFTEHYGMTIKRDKFSLLLDRCKNTIVLGSPSAGKTRYYVKPNLMNISTNYFVTDPKGIVLKELGWMFVQEGYTIKVFDTIDFFNSLKYNPLHYLNTEADILTFVECLITNTTTEDSQATDPFWENAERLLYVALISYLMDHCPKQDRSLCGLLTLLSLADAREEDESYLSPLDLLFRELETGMRYVKVSGTATKTYNENSREFDSSGNEAYQWVKTGDPLREDQDFSLSNYNAFRKAAGKTLKSIIISCNVRLKPMSIKQVYDLLDRDQMELNTLGDKDNKMVVFAIMSDTNDTFNFLFAILLWQTMDCLCNRALFDYKGSLPTPVHFVCDEFNAVQIPNAPELMAVIRSRNIFMSILLQSIAQLKNRYKDNAQTIIDCCDTMLFLGGKSTETNKEIAEMIGKQTLSTLSVNESRGYNDQTTKNYNRQERDLMQASELGRLRRDRAVLLIAGCMPLLDKKYPLEKHPRYNLIDPGHKGAKYQQLFDFKDYSKQLKEEVYDLKN